MNKIILMIFVILFGAVYQSFPCSTVNVLNGDRTVSARTMDFFKEMHTQISIVPKGTKYSFGATKYNLIAVTAFGIPAHSVNEKGLSGAMLWLNNTKYSDKVNTSKKIINCLEYLYYVMGNYQTIKEVKEFFNDHDIDFVNIPEEIKKLDILHQHAYFVDAKGNTLIIEWLEGKIRMYENESPVLVNDPDFETQKKIWSKQLETKEDIINWEYNLIGKKMHAADTRYEMLRRLTENSIPTKGIDTITKAFQIMSRVNYMKIKPYLFDDQEISWTLYTIAVEHIKDNVKIYYKDDSNAAIRMLDFNKIKWKPKKFNIEFGDKFIDLNKMVNRIN
ncbi:MAG: linear amide C-N hydrolase [Desulfobacterales bacterium]|nr:linear amide C-N hydrolase [Desulfobacterales bacterium]MBF0396944.1 linear amide C-N hydrolase [Desulfobacterales bacterium]